MCCAGHISLIMQYLHDPSRYIFIYLFFYNISVLMVYIISKEKGGRMPKVSVEQAKKESPR